MSSISHISRTTDLSTFYPRWQQSGLTRIGLKSRKCSDLKAEKWALRRPHGTLHDFLRATLSRSSPSIDSRAKLTAGLFHPING